MQQITIYQNIYKFKEPHKISLISALNRIGNGKSKETVLKLRNEADTAKQDIIKKSLPCVVFSGVFSARRDDAVESYSNLIVLDFDYVINYEQLKAELCAKDYILAVWRSPRGNGIKALVLVEDGKRHIEHFLAIEEEFPEVDKSGKNISRACFESYDPDIYINLNAKPYTKVKEEKKYNGAETAVQPTFFDADESFKKLKVWLDNKAEAFASGNRNNYIYKLAGACCRFGIDEFSALDFIMRNYCTGEFNQKEIKLVVASAYRKNMMGVASFERGNLIDARTRKEVDVKSLDDGFEEYSHVIFADEVKDAALRIYDIGYDKLEGINIPCFDYRFKLKRKEITLISGFGNMGKSTMMLFILLNRAILYGEKFAIYTPESAPAEEFYLELVEMLAGGDCSATFKNTSRPSRDLFTAYYDFIGNHFFFIYPEKSNPTPSVIKEQFLELIIKENVSGCIIDPFNQLHHDRKGITREDFYLEELLSDLTKFAEQNNIYFLIVAHPKGSDAVIDPKTDNYKEPNMYSISGGGMWANKMHNILIYHRPLSRTDPTNRLFTFTAEKIKKQKIVGKKGTVSGGYDIKSRRFEFIKDFDINTGQSIGNTYFDPLAFNLSVSGKFDELYKDGVTKPLEYSLNDFYSNKTLQSIEPIDFTPIDDVPF